MKNLLHALVLCSLLFTACDSSADNETLHQVAEPSVDPTNLLLPLE